MAQLNEQEVFVLADQALLRTVSQIQADQWDLPVPPEMTLQRDRDYLLREIVNYHAYEDAWVPDMLAGRTMDEVGTDAYQGDLLGADPRASFAGFVEQACAAVRLFDDPDRTVHCSFGDYPARGYLWQANSFRGLRAVDIARVIDADDRLPDELVQGLWDELSPVADQWRTIGIFGPAIPVADDAPLQERLLGLTGRQPRPAGT